MVLLGNLSQLDTVVMLLQEQVPRGFAETTFGETYIYRDIRLSPVYFIV